MPRLPVAICFAALWTLSAAAKGVPPSEGAARCPPEELGSACAARMIIGGEGLAEELRLGLHSEIQAVDETTLRAALDAYLAERAAWGETNWEELAYATFGWAAPGDRPHVAEPELQLALDELLDRRQSWGTHPVQVAGVTEQPAASAADTAAALKALLAERESWGTQPSQAAATPAQAPAARTPDAAAALKGLLDERASWGTQPSQTTATPAAAPSTGPTATPESNQAALKALLDERASWGTKPSQATAAPEAAPAKAAPAATATPASNEAALKALLKERASWGTKPSKSAAVAAPAPTSPQTCEAALRSIASEGTIRFETASAELDSASHATLDRLAATAKECGNVRIRIEGHTDDTGTARSNRALSQQRAEAVSVYLGKAGVDAKRLQAAGLGETKPLVANDTPENRAKNRRIEFSVR